MKVAFDDKGRLGDVDPLAALVGAWREAADGLLRFERGAAYAVFKLFHGEVVEVGSSDPRFETSAILVRAGKLAADALEKLAAPAGSDLAARALAAGILTRREWRWGEKIRAIEVLADLLGWADGEYRFDRSAAIEPSELRVPIPRLLLELFLRSRDRNLVEHQLGSPDAPLERAARFEEEFPGFGLTADAESVVELIDGRSTAREIAARAPADEFAVLKLLAAFVTLGLVQRAPPGEDAPPQTDARAPEGLPAAYPLPVEPEGSEPEADWSRELSGNAPLEHGPSSENRGQIPGPPIEARTPDDGPGEPILDQSSALDGFDEEEPFAAEAAPPESKPADLWDELDLPARGEALPTASDPPRPGRGRGLSGAAWTLGILAAAVLGFLLFRSRDSTRLPGASRPTTGPGPALTFPPPATAAPASRPSGAPTADARRPAAVAFPTTVPSPPPGAAARPRSTAIPRAATPPAGAAGRRSAAARGDGREAWLARARREQKRLVSDRSTRYSIQLELVCETASLAQAWRYDRRSSMWLLPSAHAGRDCFRVLWGRYGSLDAAKRAKKAIPAYFLTPSNRPAVVAVR